VIELIGFDAGSSAESRRMFVETAVTDGYLQLVYRWRGWSVAPIVLARAANPQRRDELWRTTCAEIFVALDDASDGKPYTGGPYLEFNFSPTGDWAAYRFDSTRAGMRAHAWRGNEAPRVSLAASTEGLALEVTLPLAALSAGVHRVAYASVVEISNGLSYWALTHPTDRPDFHHPQSFAALLELPA
jgi:hypothetical protein